jgi:hypothetical protein
MIISPFAKRHYVDHTYHADLDPPLHHPAFRPAEAAGDCRERRGVEANGSKPTGDLTAALRPSRR